MAVFSKVFTTLLSAAAVIATPMGLGDTLVNTTIVTREADIADPDYSQNYVASGANVQFAPNVNSFSVNYDTDTDFVVGRGWSTGNSQPITFSGSFEPSNGVGLLSVYGWSTNPLVEYYIIENSATPPEIGTKKGTFTSDGGTYEVWEHQQIDQPSIEGTNTFNQYLSIRQSGRSSGTVNIANHFNEWAKYGMNLGTLNYQTISVESWQGAGSAEVTLSKAIGAAPTSIAPPTASSPSTTSTSSVAPTVPSPTASATSSTCAGLYGQCGGIGFTGPTCCSSGSCVAFNPYYSQCTLFG